MRSLATWIAAVLVCGAAVTTAVAKPVPSGKLKAYKGPEGEIVAVLEVNDSKEVLVYFKNVGGDLEGKALLYTYEDKGGDNKEVFRMKKRGSKTYRSYLLTSYERGSWLFVHPTKTNEQYRVTFSEADTKAIKVDDVVAAYQP